MYTYLALGDSYTIGEQVAYADNFPNQLTTLLRAVGTYVADPMIVATTGWTTDELSTAIRERHISGTYDFVTLLIGVNNQYRGRDTENYTGEFHDLLVQAIAFAGSRADKVFVVSIPDWGATPFAADRDRVQIAQEIDAYNAINRQMASEYGCGYLEITESTRQNADKAGYLAPDGLHPSGLEYAIWARGLCEMVGASLK
jgi:lysophospholipase L1-like esterase